MTDVDKKNIYNELVNLLTSHCDTCNDKHRMEKILLCAFKLDLIDYAEVNEYDNVEELWQSLAKTLNINLNGQVNINSIDHNCKNGICTLC